MANQSIVPSHDGKQGSLNDAAVPALPASGPRKLVRPTLPDALRRRSISMRKETPLLMHQQAHATPHTPVLHAETFYLQKQMHAQTPMVFVLEGNDRVEGLIEWYDSDAIKIRRGNTRTLLYKSAIKYLYKAGEQQP